MAELESQALDARCPLGAFHQALEAVEVLQKLVEAALGALPRASGVHLRTLEVHFRDTCLSVLTFVMLGGLLEEVQSCDPEDLV